MGLNISITRVGEAEDHPEWDVTRHSGDREFAGLVCKHPCVVRSVPENPDWGQVAELYYRPQDWDSLIEALIKHEVANIDRWNLAREILTSNPDYWIYFSY